MSNSRIKPIENSPFFLEAIATTIVIDYNAADPGSSKISFAFQDHLTDGDGNPIGGMVNAQFDLLPCLLSAIMDADTGVPGVDMAAIVAAVKGVSNYVHNARAARDAEGAANGQ